MDASCIRSMSCVSEVDSGKNECSSVGIEGRVVRGGMKSGEIVEV